ncbi:NRDE family protein [Flavobacteriaceae bacterium]|nr:NRDE family protein [Flavobacteriaceae bacterium]
MCIVSYVPLKEGFSFISNRDEQVDRPSVAPKLYNSDRVQLIYPKDLRGNGTWFGVSPNEKKVCCLLNAKGKFPDLKQKTSRGTLALEWLSHKNFELAKKSLVNYAPFVLITVNFKNSITELITYHWDGSHFKENKLNAFTPFLWASSSLYTDTKNQTFQGIFNKHLPELYKFDRILNFHKKLVQPLNSSVYSEKNKNIKTVSITGFVNRDAQSEIHYLEFQKEKTKLSTLQF